MKQKKIDKLNFLGDPNIGLFAKASDKLCLIGKLMLENEIKILSKILRVPVIKLSVSNTNLIGIFVAMNSKGILLPKIVTENELKEILKLDLNFYVIEDTKYTALGNLILCNDKGAVVSPLLENFIDEIGDVLEVKCKVGKIAGLSIVGSCGIVNNRGCLLHRDAKEEEIKIVEKTLKVDVDIGTVNFGSPFIASGIVTNSNGVIVGEETTGPEMARIVEALGFLT